MEQFSNSIRCKHYKKVSLPADCLELEERISIDLERQVVRAGARITMETLVDYLLPHGFIPAVVPEFKGITVGGAINGAAIESTSGIYGQFNDICLSYLIWNGREKLTLSPQEHEDLFYGIAGSYGSMGRILQAEIRIVPSTEFVRLSYQTHAAIASACDAIRDADHPLEAIVYAPHRTMVIESRNISSDEAARLPSYCLNDSSSEWFYSHADRMTQNRTEYQEAMPIKDYLFRHDRGSFWMAGYGARASILFRYALHKMFGWDLGSLPRLQPANPSYLLRALFGRYASSQILFRSLHNGSEQFFKDRVVIQDFYLPVKHAAVFAEQVIHLYHIQPLWLCPVRATTTPQLFSPHFRPHEELLIDVGVYGIPHHASAVAAVRDLEQLTSAFSGRKMLYSYNFYDQEEFWKIYPKDPYEDLRTKYQLDGFLDITEKVL